MLLALTCRSVPAASGGGVSPVLNNLGEHTSRSRRDGRICCRALPFAPPRAFRPLKAASSPRPDPSSRPRLVRAVAIFRQVGEMSRLAAIPQIFPAMSPQIPCWKSDHGRDS